MKTIKQQEMSKEKTPEEDLKKIIHVKLIHCAIKGGKFEPVVNEIFDLLTDYNNQFTSVNSLSESDIEHIWSAGYTSAHNTDSQFDTKRKMNDFVEDYIEPQEQSKVSEESNKSVEEILEKFLRWQQHPNEIDDEWYRAMVDKFLENNPIQSTPKEIKSNIKESLESLNTEGTTREPIKCTKYEDRICSCKGDCRELKPKEKEVEKCTCAFSTRLDDNKCICGGVI